MKRFKYLFLALALVASVSSAWADDSGSCGDNLNWTYVESTHTLTITGTGDMNDYLSANIPWSSYRANIQHIEIAEDVSGIGEYAFEYFTGLTSITLPSSVTSIRIRAFRGCTNLATVTFAEGSQLTSIGDGAFLDCSALTSINIPAKVTSIGNFAFQGCTCLASVAIPAGVTGIGYYAFYGCTGLTSISIPASVTSIGDYAFSNCSILADVYVNRSTPPSASDAFYGLTLSNITLHVPYGASANYSSSPWSSFKAIEENPGGSCGDDLTWEYNPYTHTLTITGTGATTSYERATDVPWVDFREEITSVVLPDGITSIEQYAFYGCSNLTSINIPEGITRLGSFAFQNCSSLTSVIIPTSVTKIYVQTFVNCTALVSVSFAAGSHLTTIYSGGAFSGCSSLTSINLPNTITAIESSTFKNCTSLTSITIPSSVQSIKYDAFRGCTALTSVDIPVGVTSIGTSAFKGCTNLANVTVHWDTPLTVPNSTFDNIASNANLHVPDGTYAAYAATAPWNAFNIIDPYGGKCGDDLTWEFNPSTGALTITGTGEMPNYNQNDVPWKDYRSDITSVSLPDGLESIGQSAFYQCTALTSITIPSSVTSIHYMAFSQCTGLTSIHIPANVESILFYAFYGCSGLTSMTVDPLNTHFDSRNDCNAIIETSTNKLIAGCRNTSIPNTVTTIGTGAFAEQNNITTFTIPSSVTNIESGAFYGCTNLTDLYVLWADPSSLTISSPFGGITLANVTLHVPYGASANYSSAPWSSFGTIEENPGGSCGDNLTWEYHPFTHVLTITGTGAMANYVWNATAPWYGYKSNITSVSLPDGLESIGNYAFYQCTALTSITIPSNVTSIGNSAFNECTGLESVTIPDGVTSIGTSAFQQCSSLTSIIIPAGVTGIGNYVFCACTGLTSITIPSSVTSIGNSAFSGCSGITSITIPADVTSIGSNAFSNSGLTSITIPVKVRSIGNAAFSGCFGLETVTFADGIPLESIGAYAFRGCSSLESITIPASVTRIGDYAFQQCSGLATVTFADGIPLESIGDYAFRQSGLTSITIPDGVTGIGKYAFQQCSGLTSVTIGEGVTELKQCTFDGCSQLTSVSLPSTLTKIWLQAFQSCTSLTSITIPEGVTEIQANAFTSCTHLEDVYVSWTDFGGVTANSGPFYSVNLANVNLHFPFEAWGSCNMSPWSSFKHVPMVTAKGDPAHAGVYYSTFYHGSTKYALPAGVEAYTAKLYGAELNLTKIAEADDVLPAATAVILKSSVEDYELVPSTDAAVTVENNDLLGVNAATAAPANCYVLSGHSTDNSVTGVGFYQFSGTLGAHKAYLTIPSDSPAPKRISFAFDNENTATDIEPTANAATQGAKKMLRNGQLIILLDGVEYNAQGQLIR